MYIARQDIRRKKKLNELLDIGAQQEKDLKRLQRDATNREARLHMAEIGQILQKSFQRKSACLKGVGYIGQMRFV